MKYKKIFIITDKNNKLGTGHYERMLLLKNAFEKKNSAISIVLSSEFNTDSDNSLYIFDYRENQPDKIKLLKASKRNTIAIFDDLGSARYYADFVFDLLPLPNSNIYIPNKGYFKGYKYFIIDPLLDKIKKETNEGLSKKRQMKILFYLSDFLDSFLMKKIQDSIEFVNYKIGHKVFLRSVFLKRTHKDNFLKLISKCDIFVGYFGISIYEANYLRKPVIILNPSEYHSTLSNTLNCPYIINIGLIKNFNKHKLLSAVEKIISQPISIREPLVKDTYGIQRIIRKLS